MPRHKQLVTFQFILVLCIASVSNAQPDIVCKPADIQGRIVDEVGEPIGGAKVLVQNAPYSQDVEWYATRPEEDLLIGEATSDADGRYRIQWRVDKISAIENANVTADILVMKPNYAIAFRQTTLWREHYFHFKLKPDVEHIGKVLDDKGQPLADAEIRLDAIYNDVEWVNRGAVYSMENDVCSMIGSTLRPRAKTDK
jgi:protocatechuate 3,4-dioxygenase beta subunit